MLTPASHKCSELYCGTNVSEYTWHPSRCGSVRMLTNAPSYFQPKFIEGIGWLQDAGLVENNPITTLLSQYHQLYPKKGSYQFLVNIGSGSKSNDVGDLDGTKQGSGIFGKVVGLFKETALRRIVSGYDRLSRGSLFFENYTRCMNKTSELRTRCIRLDVSFEGQEIKLDDVEAMSGLKGMVQKDPTLSKALDKTVGLIVASMFYFELRNLPVRSGNSFRGAGRILCLRKSDDAALPLLAEKLTSCGARFVVNGTVIGGNLLCPSSWDDLGNLLMPVEFQTNGQELSISLKWTDGVLYPISGSVYRLDQLIDAQGLDAHFGLPDHRRWHRDPRRDSHTTICPPMNEERSRLGQKRKPHSGHDTKGQNFKKRRLWWSRSMRVV